MDARLKELVSAISFLVLSVVLYFSSLNIKSMTNMGIGPSFAPKLVAIGMFILSLILLIKEITNWIKAKKENTSNSVEKRPSFIENVKGKYKNVFFTIGLIALYILAIPTIGFLISTIIYLVIHFGLLGERKYWNKPLFLVVSIVFSTVIYYTFRLVFEVRLPEGIFF